MGRVPQKFQNGLNVWGGVGGTLTQIHSNIESISPQTRTVPVREPVHRTCSPDGSPWTYGLSLSPMDSRGVLETIQVQ